MKQENQYKPDRVSAPGETLQETLEAIGMSQAELARRMDCLVKIVDGIIHGEARITAEIAQQLEQVLSIPASFWLARERQYWEGGMRRGLDEGRVRRGF